MGRVSPTGLVLPGQNQAIDRAGWQCTAEDPDQPRGRCRLIAGYTHRRRVGDRVQVTALCAKHYDQAGPEAPHR